jgi:hypothetical protein
VGVKNGWEIVRHRVAIAGRVVDAATGKPLGEADVLIQTMPDAFEQRLGFAALRYGGRSEPNQAWRKQPTNKAANSRGNARPGGAQNVGDNGKRRPLTEWDQMLERPDRTQSKPNGLFYFVDLPDGDYSLQVTMPSMGRRFGKVVVPAQVSRDAEGNMKIIARDANGTIRIPFVRCALPPTLVKGKVTGPGKESGVALARVRVKGSGERAFTDAEGQYTLAGIEPSKTARTLLVSAQGYREQAEKFMLLEPGSSQEVPIKLARENG